MNGRYNLADDCFEANGPDIFATSYLNFDYDPDDKECDHFKAFLKFVSGGNENLKQLILEVMDEFSKAFKAAALEIGLEYKQRNRGRGYRGIILVER